MYHEITACRICGNTSLAPILNLGSQALTGVFPRSKEEEVETMPLELVKCLEDPEEQTAVPGRTCGLVQLKHSADLTKLYGGDYGYRSGLNQSMVRHLHQKVRTILSKASLSPRDLILDIGSNDSTLLQGYPPNQFQLGGIDPTGTKFRSFYPEHIQLVPEFFSAKAVDQYFGKTKAKVITSISMFYDLEDPAEFMQQVHDCLDDQGIWVLEQSYLPTMLKMISYDTVCHEHLEYYCLKQIYWMAEKIGFKILDVELNLVNGGSFSLTLAKKNSNFLEIKGGIAKLLEKEKAWGLATLRPYQEFRSRIEDHREEFLTFLDHCTKRGKKILGYGASTKGNVLLQYCGISQDQIAGIAEVNESKFGCYTPATRLPIMSEREAKAMKPDYFMVLPWHFKDSILQREKDYISSGGASFVFPLPSLSIHKAI